MAQFPNCPKLPEGISATTLWICWVGPPWAFGLSGRSLRQSLEWAHKHGDNKSSASAFAKPNCLLWKKAATSRISLFKHWDLVHKSCMIPPAKFRMSLPKMHMFTYKTFELDRLSRSTILTSNQSDRSFPGSSLVWNDSVMILLLRGMHLFEHVPTTNLWRTQKVENI